VILTLFSLYGPSTAVAGLIGTDYYVRYDGHVRNNGNTGVEGHSNTLPFGTDNIPTHEIPVTSNPGAPLSNARVLTVTETEFVAPMMTTHVILDIQGKVSGGAGGPDVFVNNLDSNLSFPIQFEGHFYDNDPTQQLVLDLAKTIDVGGGVSHDTVEIENFGTFHKLPLAQKQVSGTGTQADPLRIVLDIPASIVPINNGRVKVHFYFGRVEAPIIPEPSTAALVFIGLASLAAPRLRGLRG
jgi:hypothetical protein